MKKMLLALVLAALTWTAQADISLPKEDTLYDKLGRGFGNIIGAPNNILDSYFTTAESEGAMAGVGKGLTQGLSRTIMDIGNGVFELATAPLPVGPYFTYQSWKKSPWNSSVVNEYPPDQFVTPYYVY